MSDLLTLAVNASTYYTGVWNIDPFGTLYMEFLPYREYPYWASTTNWPDGRVNGFYERPFICYKCSGPTFKGRHRCHSAPWEPECECKICHPDLNL